MKSRVKHPWSYIELDMLVAGIARYGRNWKQIHELVLPNITVKGIRDMFYKLSKEDPAYLKEVVSPLKQTSRQPADVPLELQKAVFRSSDEEVFDWGVGELFDASIPGY